MYQEMFILKILKRILSHYTHWKNGLICILKLLRFNKHIKSDMHH